MHNTQMVRTAIAGAAGFSGQETLDRVLGHPELELVALGSDSHAGNPAGALDPRLARNGHGSGLPPFVTNAEALAAGADLVFCCLDNEAAAALEPPEGAVVVDLSGAHRICAEGWCYALPELRPPTGALIANPGCYATAALLALAPLAEVAEPASVVVDGKSGISGAGRALKETSHAAAVLENVAPYAVGAHRHAPEIAQLLGFPVTFVPHVVPLRRGLVTTCYLKTHADPRPLLEAAYADAPAVTVLPEGAVPDLVRVKDTDAAELAVFEDRSTGCSIVICAIDNLGKGAAGNAVQNANLALGLPETAGLRLHGVLV
jgi:N-acetyl-gamma-glutamyl-phosphate reductase